MSGIGARRLLSRPIDDAGTRALFLGRHRRHAALLAVIIAVSVFGYLLLPHRTVQVEADGRTVTIETHLSNDAAVLQSAGIDVRSGDRVTLLDRDGVDVLRVDRAHLVRLRVDGTDYEMLTHALTIDQLIAEAGVAVTGRDSVLQNGALVSMNAPVEPPVLFASVAALSGGDAAPEIAFEVRRAVPITIIQDGAQEIETSTSRPTVAQALREAGVVIGPGDEVVPDLQSALGEESSIQVRHARAVTVALPDDHVTLYTLERTVGETLAQAGITLPADSFVDPALDTPVTNGMSVRVVQLAEGDEIEREHVEHNTVYRSDASLGPGQTRTVAGNDGVKVRRYAIGYVNGVEASRELAEEYWDPEPVDTVIYYPVQTGRGLTRPDDGSAVKTLRVYATWYNPASSGRAASDPAYGRTATGVQVTYGVIAVDPDVIPLGTRMFVPGYGYGVAADTGGAVKGYIIDLGYPDGVDVDWRSGWLDIYILE
ncbi:MAG TPA: ubiquitin-like domain-containing protein [Dehalococcoidia bacterium]|nr:ubiquitin-like domain-containing protein [Dehalococcoidia bacterium]